MSKSLMVAVACAFGATASPCFAGEPTESPQTFEPDVHPSAGARVNVLLAGAALGVGSYGVAYGTSYLWSNAPTARDLRIPVVGPWMALGGAKCGSREPSCGTFTVVLRTVFATLSGLGQAGAVGVLTEGLFMKTQSDTVSRDDGAPPASVYVSPMADDTALGLTLGGQF